jgi:hypothetical protein
MMEVNDNPASITASRNTVGKDEIWGKAAQVDVERFER